jgi:hypothetical protein
MNQKINSIIEAYLESHNKTDYAIMINGLWGCGKTYYVTNELKEIVEKKKMQYIYTSLNGCDNFIKIIKKVTLRLLFKNKYTFIDDDLIDNLYDLGAGLSEFHSVTKIIYEIFGNFKNKFSETLIKGISSEINPSKIVIIFDDIERISNNAAINDFIGLIYESYSKKGYKTIIVGDETNINNDKDKYDKVKEKVIRRTISYEPEKKQQIESFIDHQFNDSIFKEYLDKNKDKLITYIIMSGEINLRTISFVLDNFLFVFDKLNDKMKIRFGDFIFKNILLLTSEYKNGYLSDMKNEKELMKYPKVYYMNLALRKRGSKIERTYLDDFYDRYLNIPIFNDFKFIKDLYNFILTGYLDITKLEKEIKSQFYDEFIPESEKAMNFLTYNLVDLEEEELLNGLEKLIGHLGKGEYGIYRLPYIYTFLNFIKKRNFVADWHYDIEKIISVSFQEAVKNSSMVYEEVDLFTLQQRYSEIELNEDYFNKLLEDIKKETSNKKSESKKARIDKIFQLITSNDYTFYEQFYSNNKIFQDIVETKSEYLFFSLSNRGISIIISYLNNNIMRISNAGVSSYNEKPALEKIIDYMEANIDSFSKEFNHLRNVHLKELIDSMKNAVEHLEKTR